MSAKMSQEEIDEVVSKLEITTGVGDPSSPYFKQLLTEDDEARLDTKGNPVVEKSRWGDCGTGLYLVVAANVGDHPAALDRKSLGGGSFKYAHVNITVVTTKGKPTMNAVFSGACLELPVDLGEDELKRRYVVEWLVDTASEAMAMWGVNISGNPGLYEQLGLRIASTAEHAIQGTGL